MSGLVSKTVTDECLFSLPLHPTTHHAADDQWLLLLNEPESSALPPQICLVLQHLWKLKKQTNWLLYTRGKGFSRRKSLSCRKDLLILSASAELSAGIFHVWKTLQRWEFPTGAHSWKSNTLNSIWQWWAGCEDAGSLGRTPLQKVTHLGGSWLCWHLLRYHMGTRHSGWGIHPSSYSTWGWLSSVFLASESVPSVSTSNRKKWD